MGRFEEALSRVSYFAFTKITDPDIYACGFACLKREDTLQIGEYFKRVSQNRGLSLKIEQTGKERYDLYLYRHDNVELIALANVSILDGFIAVYETYAESSNILIMRMFAILREEGKLKALSMDDSEEYKGSIPITHSELVLP